MSSSTGYAGGTAYCLPQVRLGIGLSAQAGVDRTELAELHELYLSTQAGQRVSLFRLQRILSQISGQTS